jgi:hypothetical protein
MRNGRWFYKLRLRCRTIFQRNQVERELDEELRFHIDHRVEQEIARGLTPEAARYVAVRAMEGTLTLIGVGIGIAGSLAVTRVMSGLLYGITATDIPTFIAMALLFASVALIATCIPARRAAMIDPTVAFRHE